MAANKYLALVGGKIKEVFASVASSPNALVAQDASGRIDVSLMPLGIAAEVVVCPSFENLVAGDFVNLFLDTAVIKARKADATTNTKPALGFVIANVTAPANATVYLVSNANTALSALTIGSDYYLSTTPGVATTTPPSAAGNIVQYLGRAVSATSLPFLSSDTIEVA